MRLKKHLNEKYLKGFKFKHPMTGEIYVEIFENPSKKELKEITDAGGYDTVRFFADNRIKKVFAWNPRLIHTQTLRHITKIKPFKSPQEADNFIAGIAEQKGQNWVMTSGADLLGLVNNNNLFSNKLINVDDWKWADKYISVTPFLKRVSA